MAIKVCQVSIHIKVLRPQFIIFSRATQIIQKLKNNTNLGLYAYFIDICSCNDLLKQHEECIVLHIHFRVNV